MGFNMEEEIEIPTHLLTRFKEAGPLIKDFPFFTEPLSEEVAALCPPIKLVPPSEPGRGSEVLVVFWTLKCSSSANSVARTVDGLVIDDLNSDRHFACSNVILC